MTGSRDAIAALIHVYAERLDAGDLEGVARLFADATYRTHETYRPNRGGVYEGAEAVLGVLHRVIILHEGTPRTKHLMTNLTIEVDEAAGAATARSYYTILQATPTLPLQPIVAGRYHDRCARVDGAWRFADRLVFIDLAGDLSQHLRSV